MKLYATTTSERASKGQGGNDYLNIDILINDRTQPAFRARIINDEKLGQTYITFQSYHLQKWTDVYQTTVFENKERQ